MVEAKAVLRAKFTTLNVYIRKEEKSGDFPGGAVIKNSPTNAGTRVRALVREDPTCHRATTDPAL